MNPFNTCYVSINGLKLPSSVERKVNLKIKLLSGSSFVSRSFEYDLLSRKRTSFNIPILVGATKMKFRFRFGSRKWIAFFDMTQVVPDELRQETLDLTRENVSEGKMRVSVILPGEIIERNELRKFAFDNTKNHFYFFSRITGRYGALEFADKIINERVLLFLRTHNEILENVQVSTRWITGKRLVIVVVKFNFVEEFSLESEKLAVEGNNLLQIEVKYPVEKNVKKVVASKMQNQDGINIRVNKLGFKKKVRGSVKITFSLLNKDNVRSNMSKTLTVNSKDMAKIDEKVTLPLFLDSRKLFVQVFSAGGLLGFSKKNLGCCKYDLTALRKSPEEVPVDLNLFELKKVRGTLGCAMKVNFAQDDLVMKSESERKASPINHVVNMKLFYTKNSEKDIFKTLSYAHYNAERFIAMHSEDIFVFSGDSSGTTEFKIEGESSLDRRLVLTKYSEVFKVWYMLKDPTRLEKEEEIFIEYTPSAPPEDEAFDVYNDQDALPSAPDFFEDSAFFEPSAPDFFE